MTQEKFEEIVNFLSTQSPEMVEFIEANKRRFLIDTIKNYTTVEGLIARRSVCFIEAVLAFKSTNNQLCFGNIAIKKEYERMSKKFKIILNEDSPIKQGAFLMEMIEFNWPEIHKYVDSMAEKYHFKKLSISDSISVPLSSLNKRVVVIEEGPFGAETHYSITTLGNIANRYRYNPVYVFVKEED